MGPLMYALQLETSSVWPRIIIIVRTGSASVSYYVIKPTTALAQIANCIDLSWIHILNMALTENSYFVVFPTMCNTICITLSLAAVLQNDAILSLTTHTMSYTHA